MKLIFALTIIASLTACGQIERSIATITGGATKTCIAGVTYLQFTSGATVQVDRAGRPVACN